MSNESFKSSQNLRKAMEEAQRLTVVSPTPEPSPRHGKYSPDIALVADSGSSVLELLRSMSNQENEEEEEDGNDSEQKGKDFKFFLANKNSNQLPAPIVTVPQTSSSAPVTHSENEVEGSSSFMDANLKHQRPTKKAPSPPLSDPQASNTATSNAIDVPNSQSITSLLPR